MASRWAESDDFCDWMPKIPTYLTFPPGNAICPSLHGVNFFWMASAIQFFALYWVRDKESIGIHHVILVNLWAELFEWSFPLNYWKINVPHIQDIFLCKHMWNFGSNSCSLFDRFHQDKNVAPYPNSIAKFGRQAPDKIFFHKSLYFSIFLKSLKMGTYLLSTGRRADLKFLFFCWLKRRRVLEGSALLQFTWPTDFSGGPGRGSDPPPLLKGYF